MSNQRKTPKLHWWQGKEKSIAFAVLGAFALIAVLIFVTRVYHWDVTTTTTTEVTKSSRTTVTTTETGKTLLDWLQLLGVIAIPLAVGFGTVYFTTRQAQFSEANGKQQHDTDVQIAENQQQEELLRTYFDRLSDLLLKTEPSVDPENRESIVRARTLAALRMLNTERKAIVLRFLHDAKLLQYVKSFLYSLDLSNTDLFGIDLSGANLSGANLSGANLSRANLKGANLSGASLSRANLGITIPRRPELSKAIGGKAGVTFSITSIPFMVGSIPIPLLIPDPSTVFELTKNLLPYLKGADLSEADLRGADLSGANLIGTNLSGADLSKANLSGAIATRELFTKAKNMTSEQYAQIAELPKPTVLQEAKTAQAPALSTLSDREPDQTGQKEAEQKEHN